jgi:transposase
MQMRVTKAASHFSVEEVKKRMNEEERPLYRKRWRIVYHALVDPCTAEEMALHCGVSRQTVHHLISQYNRYGLAAIETAGKGGRRRAYLLVEQERQLLEPFFDRAQRGDIAPCAEIQQAYERSVGHVVDESMIYRLLKRHGWRKIVPRSKYPKKASKEAREA